MTRESDTLRLWYQRPADRWVEALPVGNGRLGAMVFGGVEEERLAGASVRPEWGALLRDIERLQEIETEQEGKHFILRTPVTGDVGRVFKAVGIALPPNIREAAAQMD